MKKVLALFVVISSLSAFAYFKSGNDLVADMREWEKASASNGDINYVSASRYSGYVSGIYDALDLNETICPPNANVTVGQANSIVASYLKDNPARWSDPAYFLVYDALLAAFQCRE